MSGARSRPPGGTRTRPAAEGRGTSALPSRIVYCLSVFQGPDAGRKHLVRRPRVVIGHGAADLQLADAAVGARHCVLEISGLEARLRDPGTDGGTRVNEEPITETTLHDRDVIRVGLTEIVFTASMDGERDDEDPQPAAETLPL